MQHACYNTGGGKGFALLWMPLGDRAQLVGQPPRVGLRRITTLRTTITHELWAAGVGTHGWLDCGRLAKLGGASAHSWGAVHALAGP